MVANASFGIKSGLGMKNDFSIIASTLAVCCAALLFAVTATETAAQNKGGPGVRGQAPGAQPQAPAVRNQAPAAQSPAPGAQRHAPGVRHHVPGARHPPVVHSHTHYRSPRVGFYVGTPWVGSPYWHHPYAYAPYSPYYSYWGHDPYYQPPVVIREEPMVYIEPPQPAPPPQYWYYCEESKTYYPYVQTCATPWVRVLPYPTQ